MGIIGTIIIILVGLSLTAILLSFYWVSKLGCVFISIFSSVFIYRQFNLMMIENCETDLDTLLMLVKLAFLVSLSYLFFRGPEIVDMSNDGIYEWQEGGRWFAARGDDWFAIYLKNVLASLVISFLICFFATDLGAEKYVFWIPVFFGGVSLISMAIRMLRK